MATKVLDYNYDIGVKSKYQTYLKQLESMIRKYHNHKLHREEEPHNHHEAPGR